MQLQLLLAFFGLLTESADRALAVHLVSFLHSDSPFSLKRISQPEPIDSGRRVATFYGLSDILLYDLRKEIESGLGVDHPAHYYSPVWSPDGRHIAYTSNQHGGYDIFLKNPKRTEKPRKI